MNIRFLGHASFIIESTKKIAIDPFNIKKKEKVDYILITHSHYDHFSPPDILILSDPSFTIIAGPEDCVNEKVRGACREFIIVEPGKVYTRDITFTTVAAYNINKPFHPRGKGWVGYIIRLEKSIYHAGDTDFIPEMRGLQPDIFLVPVGGIFTMNSKAAAEAVKAVCPGKVIPMHYGSIVGSRKDAEKLKDFVAVPVEILEPEV
jgi:L-ascorbate metabolism protein UlaG (beta-lactamase superfamily)